MSRPRVPNPDRDWLIQLTKGIVPNRDPHYTSLGELFDSLGGGGGGTGDGLSIRDIPAATVSLSDLALNTVEVLRLNTGALGIYANDANVLKYIPFITLTTSPLRYFAADYFKAKMNYGFGARG